MRVDDADAGWRVLGWDAVSGWTDGGWVGADGAGADGAGADGACAGWAVKAPGVAPETTRAATAEEHERLWPLVTTTHPGYARYQERTSRVIPIVMLTPEDADPRRS